uniref:Small T antigen n=1 Tax=Grenadier adomavirus TaxID=2609868 RepID=A0A6F9F5M0_9VIRU|nr:TPA_asm: small T antigen [Grenadier adomavirus]
MVKNKLFICPLARLLQYGCWWCVWRDYCGRDHCVTSFCHILQEDTPWRRDRNDIAAQYTPAHHSPMHNRERQRRTRTLWRTTVMILLCLDRATTLIMDLYPQRQITRNIIHIIWYYIIQYNIITLLYSMIICDHALEIQNRPHSRRVGGACSVAWRSCAHDSGACPQPAQFPPVAGACPVACTLPP